MDDADLGQAMQNSYLETENKELKKRVENLEQAVWTILSYWELPEDGQLTPFGEKLRQAKRLFLF